MQTLTKQLKCNLFATKDSLEEAYNAAIKAGHGDVGVTTAIHILMNTIAKEIEKELANA